MKILRFNDSADAPALIVDTAPIPQAKGNEILVRVHAAGITPTELQWYPTTHTLQGGARTGAIPGHEFSGVISAVGPDVDPGQIGREIFGMNDWFADGASAEYCLSLEAMVTTKPAKLSHCEAASVPISALTAWQGLFERANLRSGERILVHGGAGAVGAYVIQLARRSGAYVIATGSVRNFDYMRELGANEVIDYRTDPFENRAQNIDVVFDGVGGETLERSWNLLANGGRVVTIAANSEGTTNERIQKAFFIVTTNQKQLKEIADLIDANELRCCVDTVVPLEKASDAYCGKLPHPKRPGKMVLSLMD